MRTGHKTTANISLSNSMNTYISTHNIIFMPSIWLKASYINGHIKWLSPLYLILTVKRGWLEKITIIIPLHISFTAYCTWFYGWNVKVLRCRVSVKYFIRIAHVWGLYLILLQQFDIFRFEIELISIYANLNGYSMLSSKFWKGTFPLRIQYPILHSPNFQLFKESYLRIPGWFSV